ncbi:MAG: hypothetical protein COS94_02580 [Candidatus Hydrogenedentes bacterium CG07_land_8_20_14_0_80_42_17]|nr:MAG: hypothetical protein COS94_02580 [Candidatus Hydrogenedentes bacterium CG07_land_8_20_14_0_80_42_17]
MVNEKTDLDNYVYNASNQTWRFLMDSKQEKNILLKFKNGKAVENEEEEKILIKYSHTGWVCLGVNMNKMKPEAKLTKRGKWLVQNL